MQDDTINSARRLLPRWRSLARTPPAELFANSRSIERRESPEVSFYMKRFRSVESIVNAADVIDAAIMSGDHVSAVPAALYAANNEFAEDNLRGAANQILARAPNRPLAQLTSADEWNDSSIRAHIAKLKQRLRLSPRDGLTALEIARLQSQLGQPKSAQRYVERALVSAPNDRYTLRSAARFYALDALRNTKEGDVERALHAIWRSDSVRFDPWVQAAEVAVAGLCGKSPKWATRSRERVLNSRATVNVSELASGLASLEMFAGAPRRKVRKLFNVSLVAPTENALAQAVWSAPQANIHFDVSSHLNTITNAHEARARAFYDKGKYAEAAQEAWEWLQDQHLSPLAAQFGAFLCCTLLAHYPRAVQFSELGLKANPNNPALLNSRVVALAFSGKIKAAIDGLQRLQAFEHDPECRPFVYAARGLIDFRNGAPATGRLWYERAVQAGAESPKPSLAAHATVFWLEQELFADSIRPAEAHSIIDALNRRYKVTATSSGTSEVWTARSKIIGQLLKSTEMRNQILGRYSPSLTAMKRNLLSQ